MARRSWYKPFALSVVLGLFTTIAIAWVAAIDACSTTKHILWADIQAVTFTSPHGIHAGAADSCDDWGASYTGFQVRSEAAAFLGPRLPQPWERAAWTSGRLDAQSGQGKHATLLASGWPLRCLWADITIPADTKDDRRAGSIARGGIFLWPWPTQLQSSFGPVIDLPGVLPYYPIWSGLLANTTLFSIPWLILLLVIPLARQARRRHHGLCPRCSYDRSGLLSAIAPCPECGQAPATHPPSSKPATPAPLASTL